MAVLTEAGASVGLGHLRRTQALASALGARAATVRFLVAGTQAADEPGADMVWRPWTRAPRIALETLDAWAPDAVVVDTYAVRDEFLDVLRRRVACVVAIDDLADRRLPAHLVVNGAGHAATLAYRAAPDTVFLLGPRYALLDPAFAAEPRHRAPAPVRRVLVSLGGAAPATAVEQAVDAVASVLADAVVDLALGPFAAAPRLQHPRVEARRGLRSLRPLMLEADLAVTGAGMTLYECLATGTPVVALALADNQRPNLAHLGAAAGLVVAGEPSLPAAVAALAADGPRRAALSVRGRQVVDGAGAARVADEIARRCRAATARRAG